MTINSQNYEEYFLLYADNELSKAERKMVEVFVNENPQYKEAFCMLKLTINVPDQDASLGDKFFLYRKEAAGTVTDDNFEEMFVRYHDNEVSEKEKADTEAFLDLHPEHRDSFELTGKARLSPDSEVVYRDKSGLYRKEKKGIVVSMAFWRWAAAAVLVGFGLWISQPYFDRQPPKRAATARLDQLTKANPERPAPLRQPEAGTQVAMAKAGGSAGQGHEVPLRRSGKSKPAHKAEPPSPAEDIAALATPAANTPAEDLKTPPVELLALKTPAPVTKPAGEDMARPTGHEAKSAQPEAARAQPQDSRTIAYNDAPDNDYVFYDVPADQFRKTKVGGFLKKVKRIVERTNPLTRLIEGNEEPVTEKKF